jgi:hypothetical protein
MKHASQTPSPLDAPQVERRIAHDYFVRFHMSVILAAVISSGVLASKCMMALGMSLGVRYPIAVLTSYGVFLLLVRVWIWYVSVHTAVGLQLANLDFSGSRGGSGGSLSIGGGSGGSGSGGGFSGFGGGTSGGGGASSSWEGNEVAAVVSQPSPAPSGSHWWPSFNLDLGDDDAWVIVLLIALVTCILGGGFYLVYAAPHILPEAAGQVILAGTLTRVSKEEHHNWMAGVIWSTWIPFVIVLLMAGVLGWEAHRYCPAAPRLLDVLNCSGK